MKKILLVLVCLFLMVGVANAQSWITANQATVGWDAVAPVATGDVIKYQVYTRVGTSGAGSPVGGEITATQTAITFNVEGRYFVGVKAIRYPLGETVGIPSVTTSWSNDASVCAAAGPFGIVYFAAPPVVQGLRNVP
ncbi:hypothetical protein [Candidatus Magnetobacterium casense]|uniref:Secreted protein n=1 Tax=Candidatus Magnetobacterium casense TaxID=1455061 RepID=A0ABS6S4M4_9BACT|nr:hypothetical protein [Candidatus Magnetobacterium casensis]MBV6343790.1 hypothetical protein [Candidatus Magnetobacterium casensis]